jgi:tripartite-type tricarboxylate transporter receptor subunit TctC
MSLGLKQPVLIDNRSGIRHHRAAAAAKAAPDGYTLVMLATPTLLAGHLYGPPATTSSRTSRRSARPTTCRS